ncbi:MAG: 3-hydroxyacyl-ACP dehydratase FabZ [Betaproteobacteria bacterium]
MRGWFPAPTHQGGNRSPFFTTAFNARSVPVGGQFRTSEIIVTTSSFLPASDINEILKHIPHRYPFLLVDRMEACEPNKWVRVIKNVSANDWFFAGVPAGKRVMPQMLVLEALAQAAGVLCHYSGMMSRIGKSIIFFAGIENCKFGRDVVPGDRVVLECTMNRSMRGVAKLSGSVSVNQTVVLSSDLTAVIRVMNTTPLLQKVTD